MAVVGCDRCGGEGGWVGPLHLGMADAPPPWIPCPVCHPGEEPAPPPAKRAALELP